MNYVEWLKHMNSTLSSDRSHAADEIPENGDRDNVAELLVNALDDNVDLVRVCAADTLSMFPIDKVRVALRRKLRTEEDGLVKSFLISSLGTIGEHEDLVIISQHFRDAKTGSRVAVHCAEAVVELGIALSMQQIRIAATSLDFKIATGSLVALERILFLLKGASKSAQEFVQNVDVKSVSAVGVEAIANIQKLVISD